MIALLNSRGQYLDQTIVHILVANKIIQLSNYIVEKSFHQNSKNDHHEYCHNMLSLTLEEICVTYRDRTLLH